jgi:metal-responsive CopG/Arc/MetJ family transcriptional regulator
LLLRHGGLDGDRDAMRTHIVVTEALMEEVDRVAGKRQRSRFVEEAIREKLARQQLTAALSATAGVLSVTDYPEWESVEQISAWVHAGRRADDAQMAEKLGANEA